MPNEDSKMSGYDYRKMRHRCVNCNEQDAYTMNGRTLCASCAEKMREKYNNNPSKNERIQQIYERTKERKKDRLAAGLCVRCGKNKTESGMKMCAVCRKKSNAYKKKKRQSEYIPDGCEHCHKRPKYGEHRLCKECYEISVKGLEKARMALKNDDHAWRDYWKGRKNELQTTTTTAYACGTKTP